MAPKEHEHLRQRRKFSSDWEAAMGGDSIIGLADWDVYNTTNILVSSVLCWPIIPAVSLGYSGYSTRHSGLASIIHAGYLISIGCCSVQWWVIGYVLIYREGNGIAGGLKSPGCASPHGRPFRSWSFSLSLCYGLCYFRWMCMRTREDPASYPIYFCRGATKSGIVGSSGRRLFTVLLPTWSRLNLPRAAGSTALLWEVRLSISAVACSQCPEHLFVIPHCSITQVTDTDAFVSSIATTASDSCLLWLLSGVPGWHPKQ